MHTLKTFTDMCQLPLQESEPHTQNQKILYNFGEWQELDEQQFECECVFLGVLSDVLDYVLEPANIIRREATPGPDATDTARPTVCRPPHRVEIDRMASSSSGRQ